jgi:TetR/AcrR family transcriptional regulator, regulator of cefoperazone and chloramphenicol sensitivity
MPLPPKEIQARTRERLLEAAGEVFAGRGFRAATVREICVKARANIAAVNYHFTSKENLYTEVLKFWIQGREEKYPHGYGLRSGATAAERLHAFVRAVLLRLLGGKGAPVWFSKLMAREMAEPTHALDVLVAEIFRPQLRQLESIVRELLGSRADPKRVRRCVWSIAGQWVIYHCGRNLIERIESRRKFSPAQIETLAKHIAEFSIAGLKSRR